MDAAKGSAFEPLLTTAALAARDDFRLGDVIASPSTRTISGPGGSTDVEPRIMQVLIVLADSAGHVVTRDTLFRRCWGGVYVGDDSLNRAIAALRRVLEGAAGGNLQIETVPRTGYRLVGAVPEAISPPEPPTSDEPSQWARRRFVGGGIAAASVAAGLGIWSTLPSRTNSRFEALMARGDEAFRNGAAQFRNNFASDETDMVALYEQAVRLEPRNARAWGLLAYSKSKSVDQTRADDPARMIEEAEQAVRRALAIDPREPNALTAMILLQGPILPWAERDSRLREILRIDGNNILAMSELAVLLQAAGLTRESWSWNERILKLAPLSRPHLVVRAQKLWILGRVAESDKVIDRVRGLWPLYEFGFAVRLRLFALTGRPRAVLEMMDNAPAGIGRASFPFWRAAAEALESRTPSAIDAARSACLDVARNAPWGVNNAVMVLCALGETEAAFELTYGYLLSRGEVVSGNQADAKAVSDWNRRMTPWLFAPPAAVMRSDPRFMQLVEEFGLAAYWRARRVRPDYQLERA